MLPCRRLLLQIIRDFYCDFTILNLRFNIACGCASIEVRNPFRYLQRRRLRPQSRKVAYNGIIEQDRRRDFGEIKVRNVARSAQRLANRRRHQRIQEVSHHQTMSFIVCSECVRVVVRIRPLSSKEKADGHQVYATSIAVKIESLGPQKLLGAGLCSVITVEAKSPYVTLMPKVKPRRALRMTMFTE
jgi:hypothetical protein